MRHRARFDYRDARVSILAAETVLLAEMPVDNGSLLFAVNKPDRICLADDLIEDLRSVISLPVYASDSRGADNVAAWIRGGGAALIRGLAPSAEEALFVFGNKVEFLSRVDREPFALLDALLELAARLPRERPPAVDLSVLPVELRRLAVLFDRWAISDDYEREERIRHATSAQRRSFLRVVTPLVQQIDNYLASFGSSPLPEAAIRVATIAELAAELRAHEA
jgi:hypothetical protein